MRRRVHEHRLGVLGRGLAGHPLRYVHLAPEVKRPKQGIDGSWPRGLNEERLNVSIFASLFDLALICYIRVAWLALGENAIPQFGWRNPYG